MKESRYYRYEKPCHYDQLPFGTEIVHIKSSFHEEAELYQQVNRDSSSPLWVKVEGLKEGSNTAQSDVCDALDRKGSSSEVHTLSR